MSTNSEVDVLIMGAGPVGLTLAAECQRHGVAFRIVDQNPDHSIHSKALAVWSNTIEHLAALGLAERFLAAGRAVKRGIFEDNGHAIAELSIVEGLESVYPHPFILPQCDTEALLIEHLTTVGVAVERNTLGLDVRPAADHVTVDLQRANGEIETVTAKWVAGCDGARSLVRHKLPVEFVGVTENLGFILADAKATGDLPTDGMLISSGPGGNVIVFPVKDDIFRFFALRETADDKSEPTLAEIQQHVDGSGLTRVRLSEPTWLSHFAVNERVASRNRVGRVFLLGDASHIHSPAGGQGMNTGMQDAFNLGWKLKLLTSGQGDAETIAESYFEERHAVAEEVVEETSNLLHFGVKNHPLIRAAKRLVLPLVSKLDAVKKNAAHHLSELGICYQTSGLVEPMTQKSSNDLLPGTLARDAQVFTNDTAVSLWRELLHPGHTLLIFSGLVADPAKITALLAFARPGVRAIVIQTGTAAAAGAETLLDSENKAHVRYGFTEPGWVLVRPDQYLAARGSADETTGLEQYLAKIS